MPFRETLKYLFQDSFYCSSDKGLNGFYEHLRATSESEKIFGISHLRGLRIALTGNGKFIFTEKLLKFFDIEYKYPAFWQFAGPAFTNNLGHTTIHIQFETLPGGIMNLSWCLGLISMVVGALMGLRGFMTLQQSIVFVIVGIAAIFVYFLYYIVEVFIKIKIKESFINNFGLVEINGHDAKYTNCAAGLM